MMSELIPLRASALGIAISATETATAGVQLPGTGKFLRVVNEGPNIAFIAIGGPGVVAALPAAGVGAPTCTPILAGVDVVFSLQRGVEEYISAVCRAAGTATLTVQTVEGV